MEKVLKEILHEGVMEYYSNNNIEFGEYSEDVMIGDEIYKGIRYVDCIYDRMLYMISNEVLEEFVCVDYARMVYGIRYRSSSCGFYDGNEGMIYRYEV